MSHFTSVKTQFVDINFIIKALQDLDLKFEVGQFKIRGFGGKQTEVDIKIKPAGLSYDVGLRKKGDTYEVVADWMGVHGLDQRKFIQSLNQRYAYHATCAKLEEQGFTLATETKEKDGNIHLILRRIA